jgi:hypothetical protein
MIEPGIDANKENHPGEDGNGNENGNPEDMEKEPTGADKGDRGEND